MKRLCKDCPTKFDCMSAFGAYWRVKSGGDTGCNHPFRYRTMEEIEREKMEEDRRRFVKCP